METAMRRGALAVSVLVSLSAACSAFGAPAADEIEITPAQIETLGIVTAKPEPVTEWQGPTYPASVVIPPDRAFAVNAPLEGLVAGLKVAFGDTVSAGQVVATISSPAFLELQRDFLQSLNDLKLADTELVRDTRMAREGIIAERRLQTTEARHTEAVTRAAERRRALRLAGLGDDEIDGLAKSRSLIQEVKLRAPVSGVVTERLAEVGQQVGRSAPLYRVADLSVLWAEISVPTETVGAMAQGARAVIETREDGGRTAQARVISIGPVVNPEDQTVMVRAEISDGAGLVRPGQFVRARILGTSAGPAFRLPVAALVRSAEARYVFVRTEKGFRMQAVTVAASDERYAVVTEGLDGSEEVAVQGAAAIKGRRMGLGGSP
jgi:RND family efflux transporter MFP subunit